MILLLAILLGLVRPAVGQRPYAIYVWGQVFQPDTCGTSPNGAYVSWRDERNWDAGCFSRPYDTPDQRSLLFDALGPGLEGDRAVKTIFLSVAGKPHTNEIGKIEDIRARAEARGPGEACPVELMTTIAEAHQRGMKVYALFGDDCHDLCEKEKVADVADYNDICREVAGNVVQFDGVALNNEYLGMASECGGRTDIDPDPNVRDSRDNAQIWLDLLDGLATAKERARGLSIHFSLGHSWAYCRDDSPREIEWRNNRKKVVEHMMDMVDSVDIQVAWAYVSDDGRPPEEQEIVERAQFYHDYWFGTLRRDFDEANPSFFVLAYTNPVGSKYKFIYDEFDRPNRWDLDTWRPLVRLEEEGAYALTGLQVDGTDDGYEAQLAFPKNIGLGLRGGPTTGPGKATQIQSNEDKSIKRGDFEARLITARGRTEEEGIVSAFFVGKFYECVDDNGDIIEDCPPDEDENGIPDNHEIDFEFQNSARSVLYLSVWRDRGEYPEMKKRTARIDIAQGIVIENVPDDGSGRPLDELDVENAYHLGFSDPTFDHSSRFYTYSFEWRKNRVTFYIDLEDGAGRRQLFEVTNELNDDGDVVIRHVPDIALRTYANVWHTYANWYPHNFDATELVYRRSMHIDYIKAVPSTPDCQTSFAPHSKGALEAETSCTGGLFDQWDWTLDRTQRVRSYSIPSSKENYSFPEMHRIEYLFLPTE